MSLFTELKRRNVFKVALAYLVASWLVLQVTDVLMGVLSLPETAGKFVFLLLVIGFIPAMVFAWAYEVTPDGIKRESEVDRSESMTQETAARLNRTTIVLLVAVAVMVVVDRFIPEAEKGSDPISQPADSVIAAPLEEKLDPTPISDVTPSVAVLPFVNMSSDQENEYFSDGITEELLNLLVRVEGLRVPSRTSSFAFKGQNTDIRDIARQLEVNHILEGSVRKAGNQVRITAQLIDVTTDTHLWSDTYDRHLEDIFAIQDEIATKIVRELELTLTDSRDENRPTENLEAYNLYLQGLYQFRQRYESVRDAEGSLRRAVELDPDFAEAWALLALNYSVQPNYLFIPLESIEAQALEAAARAESLDPTLIEPELVRGNIASKEQDLLGALEAYERGFGIRPNDALGRLWHGISLLEGGYLEEALRQLDIARKLDPAAGIAADWQSRAHYMVGNIEEALRYAGESLALGRPAGIIPIGYAMLEHGVEPTSEQLASVRMPLYWESWQRIIRYHDQPDQWPQNVAWADSLVSDLPGEVWFTQVNIYGFFAPPGDFLAAIERQFSMDATLYTGLWWPAMKHVRQDPAFKVFAREHGLLDLWQSRGWPDLCRPLGDDGDFECD